MHKTGTIYGINGPVIYLKGNTGFQMAEMVYVGKERLVGEVIRLTNDITTIQVFEETTGLRPGDPVEATGDAISVTLGPGILNNIFDGIERPLSEIAKSSGKYISRGVSVDSLDTEKKWQTHITVKPGEFVSGGTIIAEVQETQAIVHKSMVPPNISGTVLEVAMDGEYGGILGPAHPFGEKYLSFGSSKKYQRNPKIMQEFDFLEAYNSCEVEERNQEAKKAARKYFLAEFGGSDSHKADCIGTAYTEFREPIHTESDLIEQVKRRAPIKAGGTYYHGTTKEKIGKANDLLLYSFWVYNKVAGFAKYNKRRKQRKYLPLSISGGQGLYDPASQKVPH